MKYQLHHSLEIRLPVLDMIVYWSLHNLPYFWNIMKKVVLKIAIMCSKWVFFIPKIWQNLKFFAMQINQALTSYFKRVALHMI